MIQDASVDQLKAMQFLHSYGITSSIQDAYNKADEVTIYENQTRDNVASTLMEELYNLEELPPILINHIDYAGIGQDLELEGGYTVVNCDVFEYTE